MNESNSKLKKSRFNCLKTGFFKGALQLPAAQVTMNLPD